MNHIYSISKQKKQNIIPSFNKLFSTSFYLLLPFSTFFCLFLPSFVFSYDITNSNQGKVVESQKVDTSIPTWFKPMETDNLNQWLSIFPAKLHKYRSSSQFMVIPAMGMITPIVELDHSNPDYKKAIKWWDFDYMKYLIGGPTIYPGTASVWEEGNTFIFAHSNFWVHDPGDFKTIFRLTYNIEKWDKIYYYKKIGSSRKQYTYEVTQSMLVNEDQIEVMLPTKWKKELTLSACWPIGTAKQRWINKAILLSEKNIDYEIKTNQAVQVPTKDSINNWIVSSGQGQTWTLPEKIIENKIETTVYNPWWYTIEVKFATKLAIDLAQLIISNLQSSWQSK